MVINYIDVYFCTIVGAFNAYVELTGCTSAKHPSSLSDDTPLVHLLSYSTEDESSNDLLYTVICDVVRTYDCMLVSTCIINNYLCSPTCVVHVDHILESVCD